MGLFPLISVLISLAAVASYLNYRYIKLPTTIGVMLVALVGSLGMIIAGPYAGGFRDSAGAIVAQIDFNQTVLHGLLAFLLFAGSIHVKVDDLAREWKTSSRKYSAIVMAAKPTRNLAPGGSFNRPTS